MTVQAAFLFGIVAGLVVSLIVSIFTDRISGVLRIDHSNPEKDIYRFEFYESTDLSKKRRVIVKVDNNADLAQK